jgi:hypothetical protein
MAEREKSTAKTQPGPAPHPLNEPDNRPQGETASRGGGEVGDPGESGAGRGSHIPPGRNDTSFNSGGGVEGAERD